MKISRMKRTVLVFAFVGAYCNTHLQVFGAEKFAFLKIEPSTRAEALGTATTAAAFNFADLYSNPASLCRIKNMGFSSTLADWFKDINYSHFAFGINSEHFFGSSTLSQVEPAPTTIKKSRRPRKRVRKFKPRKRSTSAFAVSITSLGGGKLEERDESGELVGEFGVSDYAIGLSYATGMQNLSYGFTFKTIVDKIADNTAMGFCIDGGVLYEIPFDILPVASEYLPKYAGATLMNLGPGSPTNLSTGIAYVIPMSGAVNNLIVATDFLFSLAGGGNGISLGVETEIEKMFFVRAGYRNAFQEYRSGLSFGVGFVSSQINYINLLRVDYAYSFTCLQNTQRFSLGLEF